MYFKIFLHQNKLIFLKTYYVFKREMRVPIHWLIPQIPTTDEVGPGLEPGTSNTIQVSQRDPTPAATTTASQGLSWQEAGVRSQSRELNPGIQRGAQYLRC